MQENRKGGKKGPEEQAKEQEELSKAIIGDWRLVFTTGEALSTSCEHCIDRLYSLSFHIHSIARLNAYSVCDGAGTKGTQKRIGNINYFPLKAYQSFAKDGPGDYKNTIYLGSWPAVQVSSNPDIPFVDPASSSPRSRIFIPLSIAGLWVVCNGAGAW